MVLSVVVVLLHLCIVLGAIYIYRQTYDAKRVVRNRIVQVTIIYMAFPLFNTYDISDTNITIVVIIYALIKYPSCVPQFIMPWIFFTAIAIIEVINRQHVNKRKSNVTFLH